MVGKNKRAAVAWGLFLALWALFSFWLHAVEYDPERVSAFVMKPVVA